MTLPESLFAPWETFYVIVGSSGGALTGLLFVVVALAADRSTPATERGLSAFTTPSIFHFVVVMAIAALVTMPRRGLGSLSVLLGLCALVGGAITVTAVRRIMTVRTVQAGGRGLAVPRHRSGPLLRRPARRRNRVARGDGARVVSHRIGDVGAALGRHPQRVGRGPVQRDQHAAPRGRAAAAITPRRSPRNRHGFARDRSKIRTTAPNESAAPRVVISASSRFVTPARRVVSAWAAVNNS